MAERGGGSGEVRRVLSAWLPVLLLEAAVLFVSSRPGLTAPATIPHLDKAAHLFEYALLGGLIHRAWRVTGRSRRGAGVVAILLVALLAAGAARRQAMGPGRDASPGDWLADLLGGIAGNWGAARWLDRRPAPARVAAWPRREG